MREKYGMKDDFADLLGLYRIRAGLKQQELANKIGVHRNTIVKWENRTSQPDSRSQVLRLADELFLAKEERKVFVHATGFPIERWPTEIWSVPRLRDMFFTGREEVFQSLRQLLLPGKVTVAISGLGGIGKTQTALEYVYRFHQHYEAILWLQADSWETLASGCIKLSDELGLPRQNETDKIIAGVQHWLSKHQNWLLVLDDVENLQEILPQFIPSRYQGSVLITTRADNVEPLAKTHKLLLMSEQDGILFLLRRTNCIHRAAELEKASSEQQNEAKVIWQLLNGLPLALDQAGAFIVETKCSFSDYLKAYDEQRAELLQLRGKRVTGHEASVVTTFSLAFQRIKTLSPVAADILRVCSFLHNEAIPEELFEIGAQYLGPYLTTNKVNWNLALGVLLDYSLVQRNTDTKNLTLHRLVQTVLIDNLSEKERREWTERVIAAVTAAFPPVEYATWNQIERYLPHALACLKLIEQKSSTRFEVAHLLYRVVQYLYSCARYTQAEALCQLAVDVCEVQFGPEHPSTARHLNNLAALYLAQGKYEQAESLFVRALSIVEHHLSPQHPDIAASCNNLANVYQAQGKYKQAEIFYTRTLAALNQQLEPSPFDITNCFTNLAHLYREQGKIEQAEPLFVHALTITERHLGPEHPAMATCLNNLALIYHEQGKYERAELLFMRSLDLRERLLGPEHPDTSESLGNLAILYQDQGKYEQAEPLAVRALTIVKQQLGSEHPSTAKCLNNLGELYQLQGKYETAEPLLLHSLAIVEKQLSLDHPDKISYLHNLGRLYQKQGKYILAKPLLQRALAGMERLWGPEHPKVLAARNNLEGLYQV